MLKPKKGICVDCPPEKGEVYIYAANRCSFHYWNRSRSKSAAKQKSKFILYDKKHKENGEFTLNEWFDYQVENSVWICENCGAILHPLDENIARSCQAHILPKEHFLSVATDINNRMVLGGMQQPCKCHGQYDTNWENAEKMPVFKIALERFPLFGFKLSDEEIRRLPEPFKMLLDA